MPFTPAVITGPLIDEQAKFGADKHDAHVPEREAKEEELPRLKAVRPIELPSKISPMHAPPGQPSLNVWQFPQVDTHATVRVALYNMRESKPPKDADENRLVDSVPVLKPIARHFGNANEYIKSIAHLGEKYGAVKIIPPPEWQSPACINLDTVCFNTIHQEINPAGSTSAESREFLKALALWHDRNGSPLRIPSLDRRALDLFRLFKVVNSKGGAENVTKRKLWAQIGRELGYSGRITTSLSSALRSNYLRLVKGFADYLQKKEIRPNETTTVPQFRISDENGLEVSFDSVTHSGIRNDFEPTGPEWVRTNRAKRLKVDHNDDEEDNNINDELSERERAIVADQQSYANAPRMAYYTLRQFDARSDEFDARRYGYSTKPPVPELEKEYWRMLTDERIEVERASSRTNCVFPEIGIWWTDQWNFRRLPWLTGAYTRNIETDFASGSPSQDIGMTFSTWDWDPVLNTEVCISDWGSGCTFYVTPPHSSALVDTLRPLTTGPLSPASICQNGGECYYADLSPGEILVLFDGARKFRWNHGCSLTESVSTVLPQKLFKRAKTHCAERTLELALAEAIDLDTVANAMERFKDFAAFETQLRKSFHGSRRVTSNIPANVQCAVSGHILHYSWVEPNNSDEYLSLEAAIEKSVSGTLVIRAGTENLLDYADRIVHEADARLSAPSGSLAWQRDVQDAFRSKLEADADTVYNLGTNSPADIVSLSQARTLVGISEQARRWESKVQTSLGQNLRTRPRRSALMTLIQDKPDAPVTIDPNLWERVRTFKQQVDDTENAARAYFDKADFSDVEASVRALIKTASFTPVVLQLPRDLEVLLAQVNGLSRISFETGAPDVSLDQAKLVLDYCGQMGVPRTAYGYRRLSELVQRSTKAAGAIEQWVYEGIGGPNFSKLLLLKARKPGQILFTQAVNQQLEDYVAHLGVVSSIGSSDVAMRPQASQLAGLADVNQEVKAGLARLSQWESQTQAINWTRVSVQAYRLESKQPPDETEPIKDLYSISGLLKTVQEARDLPVRPDNLSAILTTVPLLTPIANYAPDLLRVYGFVP